LFYKNIYKKYIILNAFKFNPCTELIWKYQKSIHNLHILLPHSCRSSISSSISHWSVDFTSCSLHLNCDTSIPSGGMEKIVQFVIAYDNNSLPSKPKEYRSSIQSLAENFHLKSIPCNVFHIIYYLSKIMCNKYFRISITKKMNANL
jgi:hypothetical protein